jgi:hypothetical protein
MARTRELGSAGPFVAKLRRIKIQMAQSKSLALA